MRVHYSNYLSTPSYGQRWTKSLHMSSKMSVTSKSAARSMHLVQ